MTAPEQDALDSAIDLLQRLRDRQEAGEALSLNELRRLALAGDKYGWECPDCGCQETRVIRTNIMADGNRKRTRICRHCKRTINTVEMPVEG